MICLSRASAASARAFFDDFASSPELGSLRRGLARGAASASHAHGGRHDYFFSSRTPTKSCQNNITLILVQ